MEVFPNPAVNINPIRKRSFEWDFKSQLASSFVESQANQLPVCEAMETYSSPQVDVWRRSPNAPESLRGRHWQDCHGGKWISWKVDRVLDSMFAPISFRYPNCWSRRFTSLLCCERFFKLSWMPCSHITRAHPGELSFMVSWWVWVICVLKSLSSSTHLPSDPDKAAMQTDEEEAWSHCEPKIAHDDCPWWCCHVWSFGAPKFPWRCSHQVL